MNFMCTGSYASKDRKICTHKNWNINTQEQVG